VLPLDISVKSQKPSWPDESLIYQISERAKCAEHQRGEKLIWAGKLMKKSEWYDKLCEFC
jgi:hypothetical protein